MSSSSLIRSIPLGSINFDEIAYTDRLIAAAVEGFVLRGSRKGVISKSDINIYAKSVPPPEVFHNVKEGLMEGNKLFDMLMYFSLPESDRPEIRSTEAGDSDDIVAESHIARAVFYLAFFLLTRANVPSGESTEIGSAVPAFLARIMGYTDSPEYYMRQLATFDLSKMNHGWIRYIKWNNVGQESLNRLGLGVAGYRLTTPFKLLRCKDDLDVETMEAYEVALSFARQNPDWRVHPITRDPNLLREYGNLNKNLEHLMTICFTQDDLQSMVNMKTLFRMPVANPQYTDWKTWSRGMVFISNDPIFTAN